MNVQNTEENTQNGLQSPMYVDDNNGNNFSGENIPIWSKYESKMNVNGQGDGVIDYAKLDRKSENEASNNSLLFCTNALELEETVDYTLCSNSNLGTEEVSKTTLSLAHVTIGELDETVDFMKMGALQTQSNLLCSYPTISETCTHYTIKEPEKFKDKHILQMDQSVPSIHTSTDADFTKTKTSRISALTNKEANEGSGYVASDNIEMSTRTRNKHVNDDGSTEAATSKNIVTLNVSSMSSVFSDEMCMRKNSSVSSGSEKPLSTSVLESSGLPNTSIDMCSGLAKVANTMPGQGGEQSTEDINDLAVPQHNRDAKEKVHIKISQTPEMSVFTTEKNEVQLDAVTCSTPEDVGEERFAHPDKMDDGMKSRFDLNENNFCTLPMPSHKQTIPVLCIEGACLKIKVNCVLVEDNNSLQSSRQSGSFEQKDFPKIGLTSLAGQNCDDTFLIASPSSVADCKAYTSTPLPESKNMTFSVPTLEEVLENVNMQKHFAESDTGDVKVSALEAFRVCSGNGTTKPINRKLALVPANGKAKKNEVISFPKPNFKNVKAKVLTRPPLQAKDCMLPATKLSPRSPQSLSNASSPVASPRTPVSVLKSLRKKSVVDKDLKADAVIAKSHKQPINKQLLPGQVAHATTHSKNALGKVPRSIALKHTQDELDRASSSNSTRSSGSAAAVTCATSSKGTERAKIFAKPIAVNVGNMGPDKIEHNGIVDAHFQKAECLKEPKDEYVNGDIFANVPLPTKLATPIRTNLHKELVCLRSATSQQVVGAKGRVQPTDCYQRRGSASRNVIAVRVPSPPRGSQQAFVGGGLSSPRGKQISVKATIVNGTRSLPRPRGPGKGAALQRTPSVSSLCSTQSEQSTVSTKSTEVAGSIKTEEVPAKCMRQTCAAGTQPSKGVFSRVRSQSLRVTQTGTKKISFANQGVTKSSGPSLPLTKKAESKVVQAGTLGLLGLRNIAVEKAKPKTSPRGPVIQAQTPPVDTKALELTQCKAICDRQRGIIRQLKNLLTSSNQKFEGLTVVAQQLIRQREEALKKRKELSQELVNLRGDLVSASVTYERLEKEKNELLVAYEGIIQKVKDEHTAELSDLEEKLKHFYTGECEKLQGIFIEEAEKYKNELQEKVDDLNSTHEIHRLDLDTSYSERIETLKQDFEKSFTELKNTQEKEKNILEDSFKDKEAEIEKKINMVKKENEALKEKLKFEEERRKLSKEKSVQKNPQVMYLEQELESLKAVLEIKNEKLHQQDKKLMQIEKLVDNNTTLVERLNKCQQENEDLKARMVNHIALSRQLSTEQEVLQMSLEKESKANKRLSMENEELLWKLHNGDLCSPKKLSPTSPAIPFHPSRNSGSLPSPPVSPR